MQEQGQQPNRKADQPDAKDEWSTNTFRDDVNTMSSADTEAAVSYKKHVLQFVLGLLAAVVLLALFAALMTSDEDRPNTPKQTVDEKPPKVTQYELSGVVTEKINDTTVRVYNSERGEVFTIKLDQNTKFNGISEAGSASDGGTIAVGSQISVMTTHDPEKTRDVTAATAETKPASPVRSDTPSNKTATGIGD